jgi:tripartite-type tricarboxylate transporter receptor subunit TctC
MMRALFAASLCTGWALAGTDLAHAQAYPTRSIKMVVPFPAGGPTDGMARIVSDRLGAVLGQTIVVENHGGGAGGSIGAKAVATADPDGYTNPDHPRRSADDRPSRAEYRPHCPTTREAT